MSSLFGKAKALVLGTQAPPAAPAEPAPKRPAEATDDKPRKRPKQGGGAPRRVPELKRLRGRQAIIFTCQTRQERKAAVELWELLREYAGRLLPAPAAAPAVTSSLTDALKAEAAEKGIEVVMHDLQHETSVLGGRLELYMPRGGVSSNFGGNRIPQAGVGWATVDARLDVVALATSLLDDALKDPGSLAAGSTNIVRVLPMERVVFASLGDCLAAAAPLVARAFGGLRAGPGQALLDSLLAKGSTDEEAISAAREKAAAEAPAAPGDAAPLTYAVIVKRRNAEDFPKEPCILALAAMVPAQHRVDLKTADVTILVEVFKSLCGVAVVPGFSARRDFNLSAASGKQRQAPPKKAGAE